jgi:hypothetical protein
VTNCSTITLSASAAQVYGYQGPGLTYLTFYPYMGAAYSTINLGSGGLNPFFAMSWGCTMSAPLVYFGGPPLGPCSPPGY